MKRSASWGDNSSDCIGGCNSVVFAVVRTSSRRENGKYWMMDTVELGHTFTSQLISQSIPGQLHLKKFHVFFNYFFPSAYLLYLVLISTASRLMFGRCYQHIV